LPKRDEFGRQAFTDCQVVQHSSMLAEPEKLGSFLGSQYAKKHKKLLA
jgi:hypothetical protein